MLESTGNAAVAEVSVDQRIEKLEQQVAKLAKRHENHVEIADELKYAWHEFRNSNSSRRGLDGGNRSDWSSRSSRA
jgi:hypothetical protein